MKLVDPTRLALQRRSQLLACAALAAALALTAGPEIAAASEDDAPPRRDDPASRHRYYTGGVHNDVGCEPREKCIYERASGEPGDPLYPVRWTSEWTMYRVFRSYDKYPPPYAAPPAGLTPDNYEVSYGATYYDSTFIPADKDGEGAMMEHYEKRCLPIFPHGNRYTCSFVSLGNKAYFLRYDDRPSGTPRCCQFSLQNHPPRRDFIKHLPYNAQQSGHLGGILQAYSRVVPPGILFGYAFENTARPDNTDERAPAYRHPQSFFFSGQPTDPPNAPIVSQNYTNFRMQRPDPAGTWDRVGQLCSPEPEWCCLFATDCPRGEPSATEPAAGWSTLRHE